MEWKELVLSIDHQHFQQRERVALVKEAWGRVFAFVSRIGTAEVSVPEDEPRWHLRRRFHPEARMAEVARLRGHHPLSPAHLEEFRDELASQAGVECACLRVPGFCLEEHERYGKEFLTFLQKCSSLQIEGVRCGPPELRLLAKGSRTFKDDPHCRAAYNTLREADKPWSSPLAPWVRHLAENDFGFVGPNGPDDQRFEYAHWFGHILSHWHPRTDGA